MKKIQTIYFDMDGTIADLYNVENWLPKLLSHDESPYIEALPLVDMEKLSQTLRNLQKNGYKIGVISWLSKGSTTEYNAKVRKAKREWLEKHLKIELDEIHIIKYGYSKRKTAQDKKSLLFDDDKKVLQEWQGQKNDRVGVHCQDNEKDIFETLAVLQREVA